jgi:hypothetical protein
LTAIYNENAHAEGQEGDIAAAVYALTLVVVALRSGRKFRSAVSTCNGSITTTRRLTFPYSRYWADPDSKKGGKDRKAGEDHAFFANMGRVEIESC